MGLRKRSARERLKETRKPGETRVNSRYRQSNYARAPPFLRRPASVQCSWSPTMLDRRQLLSLIPPSILASLRRRQAPKPVPRTRNVPASPCWSARQSCNIPRSMVLCWPHPYRFVVVRKALPEEERPQTTLFTVGRYSYHAFVTNFRVWPLAVYRFYNGRAALENASRNSRPTIRWPRSRPRSLLPTRRTSISCCSRTTW